MNAVALPAPFATPKTPYPSAVKTPALSGATVNLTMMPHAECEKKDYEALETLSPPIAAPGLPSTYCRAHPLLLGGVLPDPENISNGLQHSHKKLGAMKDGRNDSQLVFYDQVIPG
ncbi:MAG: hypothetical protein CM15mP103_07060 [Gammaproteobacteria bacterium]|nr:MAG: hypothetical protein CM15mP103_07060 [Gammaproteobacteria bacterium]